MINIDSIQSAATAVSIDRSTTAARSDKGLRSSADGGVHATFSSEAASAGTLVAQAMQSPAVRQDKLEAIRTSIGNGTYRIDAGSIARAMVQQSDIALGANSRHDL